MEDIQNDLKFFSFACGRKTQPPNLRVRIVASLPNCVYYGWAPDAASGQRREWRSISGYESFAQLLQPDLILVFQ